MVVCFVPKCQSKSVHLFRAPAKVSEKWCEILNKLWKNTKFECKNKSHRVCSAHFEEKCILKSWKYVIEGTEVELPRDKWTLLPDSIPTIFPDLQKSLQPKVTPPRRPFQRIENVPPRKKFKLSSVSNTESEKPEIVRVQQIIPWEQLKAACQLINGNWLYTSDSESSSAFIVNKRRGFPSVERSIVIENERGLNHSRFSIEGEDVTAPFLKGRVLREDNLKEMLQEFYSTRNCLGLSGFTSIESFTGGMKRGLQWFSSKCVGLGTEMVCKNCKSIYEGLQKKLSRQIKIKPEKTKKLKRSNDKCRYYKKRCQRLAVEKKNLRREILKIKSSIRGADVSKIKEIIDKLQLPQTAKDNILHSIKTAKARSACGMRYSASWLMECLLLRIKSPAAYKHLRNAKILALPHPTTLTKLIGAHKCEFGMNEESLKAIANIFKGKERRDRQGVLIFDEIQLRETLNFNKEKQKLEGFIDFGEYTEDVSNAKDKGKLADHALVLMYRPFNSDWVQPIAAFATKNAANGNAIHMVVFQAIIKLEEIGAEVVAVICDGSKPNKSFFKKCGVGIFKGEVRNKITHPYDESRFLYFCSDTPHLFKCIRNHGMKYTHIKFDGKNVDYSIYSTLLQEDRKRLPGLRVCPKLSKSHISPNNFEKMVVHLATQLYSNSVANGLKFYREQNLEEFKETEDTENFTRALNLLFDLLNAQLPEQGIRMNSKSYQELLKFKSILDKEWKKILSAKNAFHYNPMASKETMQALIITVNSTIDIINYLCNELGYSYVLTGKINQDCLQKFFGIIRASGGCEDHPTVTNFLQLFRLLSLYNPIRQLVRGNCRDGNNIQVLSSFEMDLRDAARQNKVLALQRKRDIEQKIVDNLLEQEALGKSLFCENDMNVLDKNIVYYLTGFLCHKAGKLIKCEQCVVSLRSNSSVLPENVTHLSTIRDYGELIYPCKNLFEMIISIEDSLSAKLKDVSNCGDIILECINSITFTNLSRLGCGKENHFESIVMSLFPYYITMRLQFYARSIRNDLGHGKATKNKRKESRLSK